MDIKQFLVKTETFSIVKHFYLDTQNCLSIKWKKKIGTITVTESFYEITENVSYTERTFISIIAAK